MQFPLSHASLDSLDFDARQIDRLQATIEHHIAENRYPGAQIALARSGSLGLQRSFGRKRIGENATVEDLTLFLLCSQTKVLVAAAIWALAEAGELRYTDRVADLVPGFEAP